MFKKICITLLCIGICILLLNDLSFAQVNSYESLNYLGIGTAYYRNTNTYLNALSMGTNFATGFELPWVSVNIASSQNISGGYPFQTYTENMYHSVQPKATALTGKVHPYLEGVILLKTYGHQTATMDRLFGDIPLVTKEGMAYYPVFSYYNANSTSRWMFPAGDVSSSKQLTTFMGTPVSSSQMYMESGIRWEAGQYNNFFPTTNLPYGSWVTGSGNIMSAWPGYMGNQDSNDSGE